MITTKSKNLYKRAQKLIPGGVNSPVRAWGGVSGEPIFIKKGKGQFIFDEDGNKYLDMVSSWGPLILGHAVPEVVSSIVKTSKLGSTFGAPNLLEVELAERITRAIPSIQMVRFVNSGTEATMSAIRLARAFTNREKIIKFVGGYHGHADYLLAKSGSGVTTLSLPDSAGVPKMAAVDTLLAKYNDIDSVEKLFVDNKESIAAVIIEPIAGNMGVIPSQMKFLKELRKITQKYSSLLIFDEVISGFRVAYGGAQDIYKIKPDITCLGKIIGGGLPVGAYGGSKEIMNMVAPIGPVYQAGTLSGNPLAMAAGVATLDKIISTKNFYNKLNKLGSELETGLIKAANKNDIQIIINRVGSIMTLYFTNQQVVDFDSAKMSDTKRYAKFFHLMLAEHIYLPPSQFEAFFISSAFTFKDINSIIVKANKVFRTLSESL